MESRKKAILKAIIKEHVKTAQPVGSSILVKRYSFNLSPATLRYEMAELEKEGYLDHLFTSSGRIPTDKGYRYYVNELMEEKHLTLKEKIKLQNLLRINLDQLFKKTCQVLASMTHNLAMICLEERFFKAGLRELFAQPEFSNLQEIQRISKILDNLDEILEDQFQVFQKTMSIFIGKENPLPEMENCSILLTKIKKGKLGILGPKRMRYDQNKPLLNYTSKLLEKMLE